ncbi:Golgin subfamily A member 7 [Aphelenchoides besseyi]|nr:Golgin subfamily A member 7 [Aphelenchoides besseyi]KAI6194937.1 Golgin subfamily A member 7 [Aphelenchoides besseyi]
MVVSQSVALENCHKIYVERDYTLGLEVRFQRSYPSALDGLIEEEDWYYTIDTINKLFELAEAVDMGSVGETLVGFLTCYLIRLVTRTRYEKKLVEIHKFIDQQNQKVFLPAGLCLTDPVERGFRVLEITILTSGLSNSPTHDEFEEPTTSRDIR